MVRIFRGERSTRDGQPIPWCTYSLLPFHLGKLKPDFRVFEYGCGNSTLWYAQRVRNIIAVEHDRAWINKVSQRLPSNGQVAWKELGRRYAEEIFEHRLFDVVVIDGGDRAKCATPALNSLKPDGVIV